MLNTLYKDKRKVSLYSNMLMILTSVHHLYGAIVYNTSWRLHVLALSLPVIIATLYLNRLLERDNFKSYWFWIYWTIILLPSIAAIGIFEGLYNHILKNILFFGGLSKNWLDRLFPPGTYEMPDNLFFEITGIMQGIVTMPLIIYFVRLTLHRIAIFKKKKMQPL
jgi:hypothetical protein